MGENERRQVDSPGQGASNDTSLMKIGAQTAKKRGWLQEIGLKFENFDPWPWTLLGTAMRHMMNTRARVCMHMHVTCDTLAFLCRSRRLRLPVGRAAHHGPKALR